MGGHEGGDVASAIVVEEFGRLADEGYDPRGGAEAVAATLRACQRRIAEYGERQISEGRQEWYAGTTAVVALLVVDDDGPSGCWRTSATPGSIGSAAGCSSRSASTTASCRSSWTPARSRQDDVATHPERHVITRALGGPERDRGRLLPAAAPSVERLVLCSDGVSGMIDDVAIEAILAETADPRDAADRLVAAAVAAGGRDNATAVVVDVVGLVPEDAYDSERQRVSLEQKLGALP